MDPISSLVISWLSGQALTAGKDQLTRWSLGPKQQNALRKVVLDSIGPAVAEVVAAEDRELIADVLLRIGPDGAVPEAWDAASLRDLVSVILGPRLAVLAEQGYCVQSERLSATLASRIAIGIQADAACGGVLGPAAELLRHQEAMSALAQVKQRLGPGQGVAAVHTLPAGCASFTGREAELERVAAAAASGGTVAILTIDGMAGIGKTAFAVQAARQVAPAFPGGQFYVRLHGHTPGRPPTEPGAALGALLGNLGISAGQVPAGTEERAALWRDRMGGKRAVLVLDDATGSDQVRPLLPGTPETLVLVTSRRRLAALPEAVPITLDVLSPADAARLLVALTGRRHLEPLAAGVPEVTRLCGYLPLAISLTGGFLKHHSSWTAPDLADDLALAANRVVAIAAEDVSVAAAFDLSYRELTPAQQRMFRRLGLMPGPDIDAYAAAALNETDLMTAGKLLDGLYVTHLADEHARGRYRLHDLIREHAVMMAAEDDAAERDAATSRVLDYYAYCAELADEPLARRSHTSQPFTVTTPPAHAPALSTLAQANAWMLAERANLHCAVINAARHGNPAHATAIATSTHGFLRIHGYWDQALDMHGVALGAARAARDQLCEAETLNNIGVIQRLLHDYPAASASLAQALDLYRALGNRRSARASTCAEIPRLDAKAQRRP